MTAPATPVALASINEWLQARLRAAGGEITDIVAFGEECVRWAETQHGITFGEAQAPRLVPSTEKDLHESVKEAIVGYRVKAGRAMNINDFADAIAPLFYSLLAPPQTPQAAGAIDAREQDCWCNGSRNCGKPCHPDTGDANWKPMSAPSAALASPQEAPVVDARGQESAWLIEDQDHFPRHRWMRIVDAGKTAHLQWEPDANTATHFSRREDAIAFQKLHIDFCALTLVTSHSFISAAPAQTPQAAAAIDAREFVAEQRKDSATSAAMDRARERLTSREEASMPESITGLIAEIRAAKTMARRDFLFEEIIRVWESREQEACKKCSSPNICKRLGCAAASCEQEGAIDAREQALFEAWVKRSDWMGWNLQAEQAWHEGRKQLRQSEALASPQEAPPAAGAAQAVAFYIDRRIIDPATGKIGNHVKSALTWSDAPSGNWTTPVYLVAAPAPAAAKVQALRTGPPGAPSTYVNDADIVASDGPGVVVRKLDDAFHRRQTSTPKK